jgi:hypothetical protein
VIRTLEFLTFWFRNVLRTTTAYFFSRFEFLKVVRILGVFDIFEFLNMFRTITVYIFWIFLYWYILCILTTKYIFRYNDMYFFDILITKSGPYLVYFIYLNLEIYFALQRYVFFLIFLIHLYIFFAYFSFY